MRNDRIVVRKPVRSFGRKRRPLMQWTETSARGGGNLAYTHLMTESEIYQILCVPVKGIMVHKLNLQTAEEDLVYEEDSHGKDLEELRYRAEKVAGEQIPGLVTGYLERDQYDSIFKTVNDCVENGIQMVVFGKSKGDPSFSLWDGSGLTDNPMFAQMYPVESIVQLFNFVQHLNEDNRSYVFAIGTTEEIKTQVKPHVEVDPLDKEIAEGWTVRDFIEELQPGVDMAMSGQSIVPRFRTRADLARYCRDNQPYYKKEIPEVVDYFAEMYGLNNRKRRYRVGYLP